MSGADPRYGMAGRLARPFLRSKLTPVIVLASILLGVVAVALTPREEEPQIVVPMVDVMVPFPGASAAEVESQVVTPLERRLWGIAGVEYLYSSSRPGMGFITVRFKVNEPLEPSLVKVHQELLAHPEILPAGAMAPVVRSLTIDDVPFLALTLAPREPMPAGELRTLGEEVAREIADVPRTAQVRVLGGARRLVRVEPDPDRLRTLGVSLAELHPALGAAQAQLPAGALVDAGQRVELEARGFARTAAELRSRGRDRSRAVGALYLEDVARVVDGPEADPAVVLTAGKGEPGLRAGGDDRGREAGGDERHRARRAGARARWTRCAVGSSPRRWRPRSPATTVRPPARSRTSSSSTSSSRRSPSSPSSCSPWAGAPRWSWRWRCR